MYLHGCIEIGLLVILFICTLARNGWLGKSLESFTDCNFETDDNEFDYGDEHTDT